MVDDSSGSSSTKQIRITKMLKPWAALDVKIVDGGLHFLFSLFTLFYFYFYFLFLEQLRLGFISHAVTSVTS